MSDDTKKTETEKKIDTKNTEIEQHPDPDKKEQETEQQLLEKQVSKLEELILQSNLRDIAYHFTNKREVVKVNLLAGLSRGIGFTLGTAIFLAILFSALNKIITLPLIGEHIADLLDMIEQYRAF